MGDVKNRMEQEEVGSGVAEIPRRIIVKFLDDLAANGVTPEVVTRLRQAILEKGQLSDRALRGALFSEDDAAP